MSEAISPELLKTLEAALRALHGRLSGDLELLEVGAFHTGQNPLEVQEDAGGVEPALELDLELLEDESELLREVGAALERIQDGSYGRCEDCGGPIRTARLRVIPYARLCITCAKQE